MQVIEIQTLIDITDSKVVRPNQGTALQQGQYKNFVTLKQCVEMRSNIIYDTAPTIETKDIKDLGFGTKYKGKHEVWTFRFSPERSGAYEEGGNIIGCLLNDLHEIPIIKKLSETINIEKAVFDVKDPAFKNTIIKALQGTI
jgi:hypothetical protein